MRERVRVLCDLQVFVFMICGTVLCNFVRFPDGPTEGIHCSTAKLDEISAYFGPEQDYSTRYNCFYNKLFRGCHCPFCTSSATCGSRDEANGKRKDQGMKRKKGRKREEKRWHGHKRK
jgi:hypothetical protein